MKVVLFCGGLGMRLREFSETIPKPMTYQYSGGSNSTLFASEADWIAPGPEPGNYLTRPDIATGVKVIISDSDHLEGSSLSDPLWVYKNFFQGLNTLYMDRYVGPDSLNGDQSQFAPEVRAAMGQVRLIAILFDMDDMVPAPNLSTTGYALYGRRGILVLAPDRNRFNVNLENMPRLVRIEWFDTVTGSVRQGGTVMGGKSVVVQSPIFNGAVGYLHFVSSSGPSLASIANQAQSIRQASMQYASWPMRFRSVARPYLDILANSYHVMVLSLITSAGAGFALGFGGGWALAYYSSE